MPPKLMTKYEDQDSEEIASLTSGKEMKTYNENLQITGPYLLAIIENQIH